MSDLCVSWLFRLNTSEGGLSGDQVIIQVFDQVII